MLRVLKKGFYCGFGQSVFDTPLRSECGKCCCQRSQIYTGILKPTSHHTPVSCPISHSVPIPSVSSAEPLHLPPALASNSYVSSALTTINYNPYISSLLSVPPPPPNLSGVALQNSFLVKNYLAFFR